jgi:hypothetical protein
MTVGEEEEVQRTWEANSCTGDRQARKKLHFLVRGEVFS